MPWIAKEANCPEMCTIKNNKFVIQVMYVLH